MMIRYNKIQLFDGLKCLYTFMIFTVQFQGKVDYHLKSNVYVLFKQVKVLNVINISLSIYIIYKYIKSKYFGPFINSQILFLEGEK